MAAQRAPEQKTETGTAAMSAEFETKEGAADTLSSQQGEPNMKDDLQAAGRTEPK